MKIEFIPALPLSHPPVPGLHPPDEPGAFLFQEVALLNQAREPLTENVSQDLSAPLFRPSHPLNQEDRVQLVLLG